MSDAGLLNFFQSLTTKNIDIYVDGACSGNPGPGGWGAVFTIDKNEATLAGGDADTTNNRMELQAAIEALKALPADISATMYTDSQYVKNGITSWIVGWKKRNWMNSKNEPVKNKDLWEELDSLTQKKNVSWEWVKGHDGHPLNEKADALARRAIIAMRMR